MVGQFPHIYIFPGSWNMAYIAASTAVDGRGKIVVGQQAIPLFNITALKGSCDMRCRTWSATTRLTGATITSFAIHIWKPMPMRWRRECLECNLSRRSWRGYLHLPKARTRTQKADSKFCNDFNQLKFPS